MKPIVIAAAVATLPALARAQGTPPAPAAPAAAPAQAPAQTAAAAPAQKTLAQQWGLYVFPAKQQTKDVQDKDEYDCYQWAKQTSGIDPLAPAQTQTAQAQQKAGGAVGGAAKGAAVGAAIGAISGDAGKGAAIGAVAGGAGGRMRQNKENAAAQQKAKDQQQQATANTKNEFNKAFGACLEGKGYTVK